MTALAAKVHGKPHFDIALSYPQWQGSSRPERLPVGAKGAADVCGKWAPLYCLEDAGDSERIDGVNRFPSIIRQLDSAQHLLLARKPARVLTAGGDCACDIAIVDYLGGLYPDLTVLWVDAHLDANTVHTSPSGNLHGMAAAAILGAPPPRLKERLHHPIAIEQFRYVFADVGDDSDWAFVKAKGVRWLDTDELVRGPVHIHFDLDCLDPEHFAGLSYKDGKTSAAAGLDLIRRVANTSDIVGFTVTEFAPATEAELVSGMAYIDALCAAATGAS